MNTYDTPMTAQRLIEILRSGNEILDYPTDCIIETIPREAGQVPTISWTDEKGRHGLFIYSAAPK